jgi:hypothetical protein
VRVDPGDAGVVKWVADDGQIVSVRSLAASLLSTVTCSKMRRRILFLSGASVS